MSTTPQIIQLTQTTPYSNKGEWELLTIRIFEDNFILEKIVKLSPYKANKDKYFSKEIYNHFSNADMTLYNYDTNKWEAVYIAPEVNKIVQGVLIVNAVEKIL